MADKKTKQYHQGQSSYSSNSSRSTPLYYFCMIIIHGYCQQRTFYHVRSLPSLLHHHAARRITCTGHDIKSLAINFATTLVFLLPFALYFGDEGKSKFYAGGVLGVLVLAVILPPIGWMRPHPYSDLPGNKPFLFRKDD